MKAMFICAYFKPLNGLLDPRGSLSASIPLRAITLANSKVEKVVGELTNKRGSYRKYVSLPSKVHAPINNYSSVLH